MNQLRLTVNWNKPDSIWYIVYRFSFSVFVPGLLKLLHILSLLRSCLLLDKQSEIWNIINFTDTSFYWRCWCCLLCYQEHRNLIGILFSQLTVMVFPTRKITGVSIGKNLQTYTTRFFWLHFQNGRNRMVSRSPG